MQEIDEKSRKYVEKIVKVGRITLKIQKIDYKTRNNFEN